MLRHERDRDADGEDRWRDRETQTNQKTDEEMGERKKGTQGGYCIIMETEEKKN